MMRQPLLSLAAMVSLLLAAGVILLWARSYRHVSGPQEADSLDFTHADPYWWLISNPGRLTFCHQVGRDWNSPTPKLQLLGLEFAGSWVARSSLTNLSVPYWMLLLPLLVLPAARAKAAWNGRQKGRRVSRGLCDSCGYDLRGSHARCPECGKSILTTS